MTKRNLPQSAPGDGLQLESPNFSFLRSHDPALVRCGALAERYVFADPEAALLNLRKLAELLAKLIGAYTGQRISRTAKLAERIERLHRAGLLAEPIHEAFDYLRREGNAAGHELHVWRTTALEQLQAAHRLATWFHQAFGDDSAFAPKPFVPPPDPREQDEALQAELGRLREQLAAAQGIAQHEAERRREIEARAQAAYERAAELLLVFEQTEAEQAAEMAALEARLRQAHAAAHAAGPRARAALVSRAYEAGERLRPALPPPNPAEVCAQLVGPITSSPAPRQEPADGIRRTAERHLDEVGLLILFLEAAGDPLEALSPAHAAVLEAFQRSTTALAHASLAEVHEYVAGMNVEQLQGAAANVKGILHEIEFVARENADGDAIIAELFEATNHPDTDILMHDLDLGGVWEAQLKATDHVADVLDWVEAHPGNEILVTSELAEALGLPSSGFSNEALEMQVDDFLEMLDDVPHDSSLWRHVPILSVASISLVVWGLWRRHKDGRITLEEFRRQAAWATGMKAAKIVALTILLGIPIVGPVVGAVLVARFLYAVDRTFMKGRASQWVTRQGRDWLNGR